MRKIDNYDPFLNIAERVVDQDKTSLRRRGRGCLFYKEFVERLLSFEDSKYDSSQDKDVTMYKLKNVRQHTYNIMQSKMKKSIQSKDDFNLLGCWGYVRTKFSNRARFSFHALHPLVTNLFPLTGNINVCSFGGGPGNDLFGSMLAFELSNRSNVDYHLFEWIETWRPIVDHVSALTAKPINYQHADLQLPLIHVENKVVTTLLSERDTFLFMFSFVVLESLVSRVDGRIRHAENLLFDLLDRSFTGDGINAKFVILDAGKGMCGSLRATQDFVTARNYDGVRIRGYCEHGSMQKNVNPNSRL